ncbi:MAG: flagellar hook-basal body complex protein FliE [Alphaproteobacteria bacterium]|nr:flagellar hook-basal body complex protein FliE [Alphaproteobacteria bacterium]
MVMNVADALAAYRQSGKVGENAASTGDTAGGASFGDVLKNFAGNTVDTLKEGEKAASAAANGKADLASVVTAISNAELVLQEVVAIRDKVVAAYQDISKTSI